MEVKKSPKVDLRRYISMFLLFGFVVSLVLIYELFNLTKHERMSSDLGQIEEVIAEEEIIPITRQQEIQPPPPPEPPKITEVLNIVEDDVEIENEVEVMSAESDQETVVEVVEYEEEEEVVEEQVFVIVENMPEYPGGQLALRKEIAKRTKYPEVAKENDIQGKVYVQFVVNEKGLITNAKVVRGVDPSLDSEALRVINSLPKWKPGSQRGKPVKVSFTVPINFQLN